MSDQMTARESSIDGLWRITAKAASDNRGTVREFFRGSALRSRGVPYPERWAQLNLTRTRQGGLRGLHGEATTKLVGVASGMAFGAYLDARPHSRTFGRLETMLLTVGVEVLVPRGVCNGFQATSADGCQYLYCFDEEWTPIMPGVSVNPLDPELAIPWPVDPILSAKDAAAPTFADLRSTLLQPA